VDREVEATATEGVQAVKIFFHPDFFDEYTCDPAAARGRLEPAYTKLVGRYSPVEPQPCGIDDILLVHTPGHLQDVRDDPGVFAMARLAAGAALAAAEWALRGEMAFALCRPPGHHASAGSAWGFCYFNNVAVAVGKLLKEEKVGSVLIVDFDLHYGDGTENIFSASRQVTYWQGPGKAGKAYVAALESFLQGFSCDMVAVSAGFDRHLDDWGHMLSTEDYGAIGRVLGRYARVNCGGKLFAVLEGGYNPHSMAASIEAFLLGLEET
jgi:acetoin utilization deacetylase AcuC-like enzyme